jgi:hypothetical protein
MSNIIKKISIKGIVGEIKVPAEGETVKLCRLAGIANGMKTVATTFGDSVGLLGNFAGINLETGEVFNSGLMYAPAILTDMLTPQLEQGNSVEFAFDVTITGDKTVAVKYRYGLATLIEPAADDPMVKLMAKVNALALSAPAAEPAAEPKKPGKK